MLRIPLAQENFAVPVMLIVQVIPSFTSFFGSPSQFPPLEPSLVRAIIEEENGNTFSLYGQYQLDLPLPPKGGSCESFYETNEGVGGDAGLISGLSMVVVRCSGWDFFDGGMGMVGRRVYYAVEDEGVTYPQAQTGLLLEFFSCFFAL